MKKVAFTGTRAGMTYKQAATFTGLLTLTPMVEFHHGDCVGADEQAHNLVIAHGGIFIISHPPDNDKHRAHCDDVTYQFQPLPYLDRNRAMVDLCDLLIATPGQKEEILRSGTWATIRYARVLGRRVVMVYPDGSWEET